MHCYKIIIIMKIQLQKLGHIWLASSNTHFHILNNLTHISTHFSPTRISKTPKQHYSNFSTKRTQKYVIYLIIFV